MKIYVWPDYMWCEEEFLGEYECFGDDFMVIDVPDDVEDIDEYLDNVRMQDSPFLFKTSNNSPDKELQNPKY